MSINKFSLIVISVTLLFTAACAAPAENTEGVSPAEFFENRPVEQITINPNTQDEIYATLGEEKFKLDLYKPSGEIKGTIVYFFGGGWQSGSKETIKQYVVDQIDRGYVVVAVGYSLSADHVWPVQGQQTKAAVRWVRANEKKYGLPDYPIIAMGNSAGGHLAAFLAMQGDTGKSSEIDEFNGEFSARVDALVAWYGAFDLEADMAGNDLDSPPGRMLGCTKLRCMEIATAASPITYVSSKSPPVYLLHGTLDSVVPVEQSEKFANALKAVSNSPVIVEFIDGYQHGDPRFDDASSRVGFEGFIDNLTSGHIQGN